MQETILKISDFITSDNIFLGVSIKDKEGVLRFIADKCMKNGIVTDAEHIYNGLVEREESMSTGVGLKMAFPHTTTPERDHAAVLVISLENAIPYDSIDNAPVDTVFAIIIPESNQTQHLQILARISRLCRNNEFMQCVRSTANPKKLKQEITRLENEITEYLYK